MALGKDKTAVPINSNVPHAVLVEFSSARAKRPGLKIQEALSEAMRLWARVSGSQEQTEHICVLAEALRDGSESDRELIMRQVNAWKNRKASNPQERAVSDVKPFRKPKAKSPSE